MKREWNGQGEWDRPGTTSGPGQRRRARVLPNPKLKLLDQVREVMRIRHYSLRTERCYGDWIRRFIRFHGMHP
ncbi:MAG: phage integrase N-terminal SAM-like domain-containing protein [Verrucomicrobiota bacterium]